MSESKAEYHKKQSESQNYSDEPPSYSEATNQSNDSQYNGGGYTKDTKKELPPQQQIPPQLNPNDPNINPNVYTVPPQLVDITRANPQHLNPAYPRYLEREYDRNMHGDFPNPDRFKHGAPLNYSNIPKNNTMSKGFPGKSGATYNNAANR